jgi:hypothetical protein
MANASSAGATIAPFNGRESTTIATAGIEFEGALQTMISASSTSHLGLTHHRGSLPTYTLVLPGGSSTLLSTSLPGSTIGSMMSPPNLGTFPTSMSRSRPLNCALQVVSRMILHLARPSIILILEHLDPSCIPGPHTRKSFSAFHAHCALRT